MRIQVRVSALPEPHGRAEGVGINASKYFSSVIDETFWLELTLVQYISRMHDSLGDWERAA